MPVTAQPGDLAIWYAASPDQEYVAYGWIAGLPSKREPTRQPYGPVAGVRPLPGGPMPRAEVAAKAHGFQATNVGQLAVTVPEEIQGAFLRALGFGKRFVQVRELISVELAREVAPAPPRKIWHTARWPIGTQPRVHPRQVRRTQ